ncbi:unnamed protein product [Caenorhabditis angaria]|uniref:Protein phosphatase 1 regulatory subunit 21 N-terminal domain-containing protein n=1 Tax=Caenorhabditis angaria TaxID=860376 RepID=A0A9P1IYB2_9PELO|nr:unnamed protein product [Caenorhabditis angaria]
MSVSSVSLNSDTTTGRYQRLASEYAKLRAQAKVLREGVLSERAKSDKLTEDLRIKEAQFRKIEAENESLSFRNEQLVKRVENLQGDLEKIETTSRTGGKSTKKSNSAVPKDVQNQIQAMVMKIEILEGELRMKLRQNEELVIQISENERLHGEEMAQMSEKFAKEFRNLENQLKISQKPGDSPPKNDVKNPFFEEEQSPEPKNIEISSPEPPQSIEEAEILAENSLKMVFEDFSNICQLLHQRSEIYPFDICMEKLPKKCGEIVAENLNALEIESKIGLISKHCDGLLIGLIGLMCNEENKVSWCSAPLESLNKQWSQTLTRIFQKIPEILGNPSEIAVLAEQLCHVNEKREAVENRLPTTSKKMRCVSQALRDALAKLAMDLAKLAARKQRVLKMRAEIEIEQGEAGNAENNPFIVENAPKPNGSEQILAENAQKLSEIAENRPVPTRDSSTSPIPQQSCSKCSDLAENLESLESRLVKIQSEKEQQNLDFSLLKRKYELANGNQKYEISDKEHLLGIGKEKQKEMLGNVMRAEKKAKVFEKECKMLLTLQIHAQAEKNEMQTRLTEISQQKMSVEDELASVRRGYEAQIGELSNHVAELVKEQKSTTSADHVVSEPPKKSGLKSFFK